MEPAHLHIWLPASPCCKGRSGRNPTGSRVPTYSFFVFSTYSWVEVTQRHQKAVGMLELLLKLEACLRKGHSWWALVPGYRKYISPFHLPALRSRQKGPRPSTTSVALFDCLLFGAKAVTGWPSLQALEAQGPSSQPQAAD